MSKQPLAFVDATDLFPQDQRDFLVQAAADGLFALAWSDTVIQETACAVHRRLRARDGLSQRTRTERMLTLMTRALTTAGAGRPVDEDAVRAYIQRMGEDATSWGTSDRDDRHVVAAAAVAGAGVLVSSDARFDDATCQQHHSFHVMTADAFITAALRRADDDHIRAPIAALARRWTRPGPWTTPQVIGRLERHLPDAMSYLVRERGFARADPPTRAAEPDRK